jgi:predicted house-cleaning noncanonical NTP pyrophosphatase (MazG superfamily)
LKLIRDNVAAIMAARDRGPATVRLVKNRAEHMDRLYDKVQEEAHEFFSAETERRQIEEAGDLISITRACLRFRGIDWDVAVREADAKDAKLGAFDLGVVLIEAPNYPREEREEADLG